MEEDINTIQELIAGAKAYDQYEGNKYYKSMENLIARNKELERQIEIKNAYLTLINDIAYDYDGCNTVKSLKELIDELVKMITQAYKNDDWTVMYTNSSRTKNKNILQELIED